MALGRGKYDDEATKVMKQVQAAGVLLIVIDGVKGTGFSAQVTLPVWASIPSILRQVANDIEKSGAKA